jgi:hypothetical protein
VLGEDASLVLVDNNLTVTQDIKVQGHCYCNFVDVDPTILYVGTELATAVYIGPNGGNVTLQSPIVYAHTIAGIDDSLFLNGTVFITGALVFANGSTTGSSTDLLLTLVVDTPEVGQPLQVGPERASTVLLASPVTTTEIKGMALLSADLEFSGSGRIDALLSNNLTIGFVSASSVFVGRPSVTTTVGGTLVVNQDATVAGFIDTFGGNRLVLGPTNALSVDVGGVSIPLLALGPVWIASTLDRIEPGTLVVGGSMATEVRLGRSDAPVVVEGTAVASNLNVTHTLQASYVDPLDTNNNTLFLGTGASSHGVQLGRHAEAPVRVNGDLVVADSIFFGELGQSTITVSGIGEVTQFTIGSNGSVVNLPGSVNTSGNSVVWGSLLTTTIDTRTEEETITLGGSVAHSVVVGHAEATVHVMDRLEVHGAMQVDSIDTLSFGTTPLVLGAERASQVELGRGEIPTVVHGDLTVRGEVLLNDTVQIKQTLDTKHTVALEIGPEHATTVVLGNEDADTFVQASLHVAENATAQAVLAPVWDFDGTMLLGPDLAQILILGTPNTTTIIHGNLITDRVIGPITGESPIVDTPALGIPLQIGPVNASAVLVARSGILSQFFGPLQAYQGIKMDGALESLSVDGPLFVGVSNSSGTIAMGHAGGEILLDGSVVATLITSAQLRSAFLDTPNEVPLLIGTEDADEVRIAAADTDTFVDGPLYVQGPIAFPLNGSVDSLSVEGVVKLGTDFARLVLLGHLHDVSVVRVQTQLTVDGSVTIQSLLDTQTATFLAVGSAMASAVFVARPGVSTTIRGPALVEQVVDTLAPGPLLLGPTVTTQVELGSPTIPTLIRGNAILSQHMEAADLVVVQVDAYEGEPLVLGPTNATEVTLGSAGAPTHTLGVLHVDQSIEPTAGALQLAALQGTAVELARSGVPTVVQGPLDVQSLVLQGHSMDAPGSDLDLGALAATVRVGQASQALELKSHNITIGSALDSRSNLTVGAVHATLIELGSTGHAPVVKVYGSLQPHGGILMPIDADIDTLPGEEMEIGESSSSIVVGAVGGLVRVRGALWVDEVVDSTFEGEPLFIGTQRASYVHVANETVPTAVQGPLFVLHSIRMAGNATIDTGTANISQETAGDLLDNDILFLGPLEADSVELGHPGAPTVVRDVLGVDGGVVDSIASTFALAPSVPGDIVVGSATSTLVFHQALSNASSVLYVDGPGDKLYVGTLHEQDVVVSTPTGDVTLASDVVRVQHIVDRRQAGALELGPTTATSLVLGHDGCPVTVADTLTIVDDIVLQANATLDTDAFGVVVVGPVQAIRVDLGHAGSPTRALGGLKASVWTPLVPGDTLVVGSGATAVDVMTDTAIQGLLVVATVDHSSGLSLGPTMATFVEIASSGVMTTVHGPLQSDEGAAFPSVLTASVDADGEPLTLGASLASSTTVGSPSATLTLRGTPVQVEGPLLTTTGEVDTTASDVGLCLGCTLASYVQVGQSAITTTVPGPVALLQNLTVGAGIATHRVDTSLVDGNLALGTLQAATISIGRDGSTTHIYGTLLTDTIIGAALINSSLLDSPSGTPVQVGTLTASAVILARAGIQTLVQGPLLVNEDVFVDSVVDTQEVGLLRLGPSVAAEVQLSAPGKVTRIMGDLEVTQAAVLAGGVFSSDVDAATGPLYLGAFNASQIYVARTGVSTVVQGALHVAQTQTFATNGTVDCTACRLSLGTVSTTEVHVGASTVDTLVQGPLWIQGRMDTIDPASTLDVGTERAAAVRLGHSGTEVRAQGNFSAGSVSTPAVDTPTLLLVVGHPEAVTQLDSSLVRIQSTLDRATSGTLAIGPTTASILQLGRGGGTTVVVSPLQLQQNVVLVANATVDTQTAFDVLRVGTTQAAGVVLGRTGTMTTLQGSATATQLQTRVVDGSNEIQVCGATCSDVQLARSGITTLIKGPLQTTGTIVFVASGSIDASGALNLGTSTGQVTIGSTAVQVAAPLTVASSIDTSAPTTLRIGASTATAIELGSATASVSIFGSANLTSVLTTLVDTPLTSQTLSLGTNRTSLVQMGRTGGTLNVFSSLRVASLVDTTTSATVDLLLGTSFANGVQVGTAAKPTALHSTSITVGGGIDTETATTLQFGVLTATAITIGRGPIVTSLVSDNVRVGGTFDTLTTVVFTIGAQNAASIVVGKSSIDTTLMSANIFVGGTLDTTAAVNFNLGTGVAGAVVIGRSSQTTTVQSTVLIVGQRIDAAAGLQVGTSTATSLTLSRTGVTTTVAGPLSVATVDTAAGLSVGTATATSLTLSRTGVTTTVAGPLSVATLDTGAGMSIGTSTATSVTVGKAAGTIALQANTVTVGSSLDSAGILHLGATTASQVTLGRSGTSCNVSSDLVIGAKINGFTVPSAAWQALSLFSVGTWTPVLSDSAGNALTTTTAKGTYQRLGTYYTCTIRVVWTAKGSAVAGNAVRVSLPATSGTSNDFWVFTLGPTSGFNTNSRITQYSVAGTSQITFFLLSNTGTAPTSVTVSTLTNTGDMTLSGVFSST